MKEIILSLAFAGLVAAAEPSRTFVGVITDTMCGADHKMMKIAPDSQCVVECIRMDPKRWKYALNQNGKIWKLSDQQTPEKFAAKKVKVTGVLYEKTGVLKVDRIELAE